MGEIETLAKKISSKELSPVDVLEDLLVKIDQKNPKLNAFVTVLASKAMEEAKVAEKAIMSGYYIGPLHGIPIGLKDLIYTKGIRTTMGSKVFQDFIPEEDAEIVTRLKEAGGVILGKLHTHEFAYGPIGDRSGFGPARNPYDTRKITGGSSSGAACAVAAELSIGAVGTDTGGSVRIPASCCGVVGLKPSRGKISTQGVFPLSQTLDCVGPLTQSVYDNALMYQAFSHHSLNLQDIKSFACDDQILKGKRIGIPRAYFYEAVDKEVLNKVEKALELFTSSGAILQEIEIPYLDQMIRFQSFIQQSEAFANHENLLSEHGKDYDPEVYERLIDSQAPRGYEYVKAKQFQINAQRVIEEFFKSVDCLVLPTIPMLPTDIDQREVIIEGEAYPVRSMLLRNTSLWNYTGQPGLSLPCGFSNNGLPVGLQLIGPIGGEQRLYQWGYWYEQRRNKL